MSVKKELTALLAAETLPFPCVNCQRPVEGARIYCNDICAKEAEVIRYARRANQDGRSAERDVQEAIDIQIALVLGGGYDETARRLRPAERREIIDRDGGVCVKCGAPGKIVDHKWGSSNESINLQLLCAKCHNKKTRSGFVELTVDAPIEVLLHAQRIRDRIESPAPLKACDGEEWLTTWQSVQSHRRKTLRKAEAIPAVSNPTSGA